eukprot:1193254-Prorocentrum_minimum.AAC.1
MIALNVRTIVLNIHTIALNVRTIALIIRTIALNIHTIALNIRTIALNIRTIALNVHHLSRDVQVEAHVRTIALNIHMIALNVRTIALNIHTIALNIHTFALNVHHVSQDVRVEAHVRQGAQESLRRIANRRQHGAAIDRHNNTNTTARTAAMRGSSATMASSSRNSNAHQVHSPDVHFVPSSLSPSLCLGRENGLSAISLKAYGARGASHAAFQERPTSLMQQVPRAQHPSEVFSVNLRTADIGNYCRPRSSRSRTSSSTVSGGGLVLASHIPASMRTPS